MPLSVMFLRSARERSARFGSCFEQNSQLSETSPLNWNANSYAGNEPVLRLDPSGNQDDAGSISADETNALAQE